MGSDVAQEVLSKLFQQVVGEDVANIGFDMVNGDAASLEALRNLLERYGDDFIPNLNIEWDDITIETLMDKAELEARWTFNIPSCHSQGRGRVRWSAYRSWRTAQHWQDIVPCKPDRWPQWVRTSGCQVHHLV